MKLAIVVDTQGDFMNADGALFVPGAGALVQPMNDWLAALDPRATAAALFTFDTHFADTYPFSAEAADFPIHCVRDTPGWQNVLDPARVDPGIPTYRLEKGVFSMWQEDALTLQPLRPGGVASPREAFFAGLRTSGVTEAEVIGVAADYCVRWAIDGLVERGFHVTVPAALTRGITRDIGQVLADDFANRPVRLNQSGSPDAA